MAEPPDQVAERPTVAILGCGRLGGALARGMLRSPSWRARLVLCDRNSAKLALGGGRAEPDLRRAVATSDVVVLAVKPSDLAGLVEQAGPALADRVVLSALAGTPWERLVELTGSREVVRAMPNLAVGVATGMTLWWAPPDVPTRALVMLEDVFSATGALLRVASEAQLDALTPISGSGLAYVLHLGVVLEQQAVEAGLSRADARRVAEQTLVGTGALLSGGTGTASSLLQGVMTPGGYTERVIQALGQEGLEDLYRRAIALGRPPERRP